MKPLVSAPDLIARVDAQLLALLDSGLTPADWDRETIVPGWRVRHIAGHLLDTCLRRLTLARDGFAAERPAGDFVAFLNRINAEGVAVYGRLSPAVMRSQMAAATADLHRYFASLDPDAPAAFAVSWAGQSESPNWFDMARELTERWHHLQQMLLALHRPGLLTPELYHPVLDCFMESLPVAYAAVAAAPGTCVQVTVTGPCGGDWFLVRQESGWVLGPAVAATAKICIPEEIAWRIFTKGIRRDEAEALVMLSGDRVLALPVLGALAIVG